MKNNLLCKDDILNKRESTIKTKAREPNKYDNSIIELAKEYLANYELLGDAIPTITGLSAHIGICRSTIYVWSKDNDKIDFSDIVERVLGEQERVLINKGLLSEFNASMAKLLLTKHGYGDKVESTLSGPDGSAIDNHIIVEFVGTGARV